MKKLELEWHEWPEEKPLDTNTEKYLIWLPHMYLLAWYSGRFRVNFFDELVKNEKKILWARLPRMEENG